MVSDWEGRWCRHCVARSGALGVDIIRTPGRVGYVLRDSTRWPPPLGVSTLSLCCSPTCKKPYVCTTLHKLMLRTPQSLVWVVNAVGANYECIWLPPAH